MIGQPCQCFPLSRRMLSGSCLMVFILFSPAGVEPFLRSRVMAALSSSFKFTKITQNKAHTQIEALKLHKARAQKRFLSPICGTARSSVSSLAHVALSLSQASGGVDNSQSSELTSGVLLNLAQNFWSQSFS